MPQCKKPAAPLTKPASVVEVDFLERRRSTEAEMRERKAVRVPRATRLSQDVSNQLVPAAIDLPPEALLEDAENLRVLADVARDFAAAVGQVQLNSAEARHEARLILEALKADNLNLRTICRDLLVITGCKRGAENA